MSSSGEVSKGRSFVGLNLCNAHVKLKKKKHSKKKLLKYHYILITPHFLAEPLSLCMRAFSLALSMRGFILPSLARARKSRIIKGM